MPVDLGLGQIVYWTRNKLPEHPIDDCKNNT
jgi:hypothetical protein